MRHVRQAILRGDIRSNEPLRQDKLANELGVSKVPVREALAQLKAEGLVTYKSNRGAFVTALSAAEAREIYLMRIALETIALQHAIPNMSKADVARARSALMVIDAEEDVSQWGELNWEFHAAIYRHAQMPYLLSMIEMLHVNVTRYVTLYLDQMAHQTRSQAEHYVLLSACANKDVPTAINTLQTHLTHASTALEAYLNSQDEK